MNWKDRKKLPCLTDEQGRPVFELSSEIHKLWGLHVYDDPSDILADYTLTRRGKNSPSSTHSANTCKQGDKSLSGTTIPKIPSRKRSDKKGASHRYSSSSNSASSSSHPPQNHDCTPTDPRLSPVPSTPPPSLPDYDAPTPDICLETACWTQTGISDTTMCLNKQRATNRKGKHRRKSTSTSLARSKSVNDTHKVKGICAVHTKDQKNGWKSLDNLDESLNNNIIPARYQSQSRPSKGHNTSRYLFPGSPLHSPDNTSVKISRSVSLPTTSNNHFSKRTQSSSMQNKSQGIRHDAVVMRNGSPASLKSKPKCVSEPQYPTPELKGHLTSKRRSTPAKLLCHTVHTTDNKCNTLLIPDILRSSTNSGRSESPSPSLPDYEAPHPTLVLRVRGKSSQQTDSKDMQTTLAPQVRSMSTQQKDYMDSHTTSTPQVKRMSTQQRDKRHRWHKVESHTNSKLASDPSESSSKDTCTPRGRCEYGNQQQAVYYNNNFPKDNCNGGNISYTKHKSSLRVCPQQAELPPTQPSTTSAYSRQSPPTQPSTTSAYSRQSPPTQPSTTSAYSRQSSPTQPSTTSAYSRLQDVTAGCNQYKNTSLYENDSSSVYHQTPFLHCPTQNAKLPCPPSVYSTVQTQTVPTGSPRFTGNNHTHRSRMLHFDPEITTYKQSIYCNQKEIPRENTSAPKTNSLPIYYNDQLSIPQPGNVLPVQHSSRVKHNSLPTGIYCNDKSTKPAPNISSPSVTNYVQMYRQNESSSNHARVNSSRRAKKVHFNLAFDKMCPDFSDDVNLNPVYCNNPKYTTYFAKRK